MTIDYFRNKCEPNVIFKTLENVNLTTTGQFREGVNVMTPSFTVEGSALNFKGANYCYIREFGRYYFITSIDADRNNICIIHCRLDVLYTYRASLLTVKGLIARAENDDKHNKYLKDSNRQFENLNYNIPMLFHDYSTSLSPKMILITCGGTSEN